MEKNTDWFVDRGEVAKWQITITHEDFNQQTDAYSVQLSWGLRGEYLIVNKNEMPVDEEGHTFMIVPTADMYGVVKATCIYHVPDTDMESGYRTEVDIQNLCLVTTSANPQCCCKLAHGGTGFVTYERVYRGDVNTLYLNLRTVDEEPILDSEGQQLRVRKHNLN